MAAVTLYHGDCIEVMAGMADRSIDAVITDLPYGTTKCKWDTVIPFDAMWEQLERLIKPHGAIALFCTQPFATALIASNIKRFKYCWTWDKKTAKGHLVAKHRPMQQTEEIAIFGRGRVNYYPIKVPRPKTRMLKEYARTEIMGGVTRDGHEHVTNFWYPKTVLHFPWSPARSLHPTEKPVALLEYLVRTYTLEGQAVLDFTMGSGSTGVAALQAGRSFVGIEKDKGYFDGATARIGAVDSPPIALAAAP